MPTATPCMALTAPSDVPKSDMNTTVCWSFQGARVFHSSAVFISFIILSLRCGSCFLCGGFFRCDSTLKCDLFLLVWWWFLCFK